jgi:MinD superfamily P-loop ATPase
MSRSKPGGSIRPVPRIDTERCDGCGKCVRVCPTGALQIRNGVATVAEPASCEYHGLCELVCPCQAIQRSFVVIDVGKSSNNEEAGED